MHDFFNLNLQNKVILVKIEKLKSNEKKQQLEKTNFELNLRETTKERT
jgi:GTP-binding protein EngB required for normal cell division